VTQKGKPTRIGLAIEAIIATWFIAWGAIGVWSSIDRQDVTYGVVAGLYTAFGLTIAAFWVRKRFIGGTR
jgi:hypothetical protein